MDLLVLPEAKPVSDMVPLKIAQRSGEPYRMVLQGIYSFSPFRNWDPPVSKISGEGIFRAGKLIFRYTTPLPSVFRIYSENVLGSFEIMDEDSQASFIADLSAEILESSSPFRKEDWTTPQKKWNAPEQAAVTSWGFFPEKVATPPLSQAQGEYLRIPRAVDLTWIKGPSESFEEPNIQVDNLPISRLYYQSPGKPHEISELTFAADPRTFTIYHFGSRACPSDSSPWKISQKERNHLPGWVKTSY